MFGGVKRFGFSFIQFVCRGAALTIVMASLVSYTRANDLVTLDRTLPRGFAGEFRWDGDHVSQKVEIKITSTRPLSAHQIEALGCGKYDALGSITNIGIRMNIDVRTRDIEIWEFDPVGNALFVTDGSHKGKLTDSLQRITAQWATISTGRRGTLVLAAAVGVKCGDEVMLPQRPVGTPKTVMTSVRTPKNF